MTGMKRMIITREDEAAEEEWVCNREDKTVMMIMMMKVAAVVIGRAREDINAAGMDMMTKMTMVQEALIQEEVLAV